MQAPYRRGTNALQTQSQTFTFEPVKGGQSRIFYRGHDVENAKAKYNLEYSRASSARLEIRLGIAELELVFGDGQGGSLPANALALTQDRWEFAKESEPLDIWLHPTAYGALKEMAYLAMVRDGSALEQRIARDAAYLRGQARKDPCPPAFGPSARPQDGVFYEDETTDQMLGWDALQINYPQKADALVEIYGLATRGSTHFEHYRTVLRHTTSAPWYWSRNVADVNTLKVYTTEQLLTEVENFNFWNYPIPPRMAYKITTEFNSTNGTKKPAERYGYRCGWLKGESTETGEGANRIAIQTDYRYDQWSLVLYPD